MGLKKKCGTFLCRVPSEKHYMEGSTCKGSTCTMVRCSPKLQGNHPNHPKRLSSTSLQGLQVKSQACNRAKRGPAGSSPCKLMRNRVREDQTQMTKKRSESASDVIPRQTHVPPQGSQGLQPRSQLSRRRSEGKSDENASLPCEKAAKY